MALVQTASAASSAAPQNQNCANDSMMKDDVSNGVIDSWIKKPPAFHDVQKNHGEQILLSSHSVSSGSSSVDEQQPDGSRTSTSLPQEINSGSSGDSTPEDTPPKKMLPKRILKSKVRGLTTVTTVHSATQSQPLAWDASTWHPRKRKSEEKDKGQETAGPKKKFRMDVDNPIVAQYMEVCTYPDSNTAAGEICRQMRNGPSTIGKSRRLFFDLSGSNTTRPIVRELSRPLRDGNTSLSPYALYRWLRVRMTAGLIRSSFSILHTHLQKGYEDSKKTIRKMDGSANPERHIPELLTMRDRLASLWCVYVHFTIEVGKVVLPDDKQHSTTALSGQGKSSAAAKSARAMSESIQQLSSPDDSFHTQQHHATLDTRPQPNIPKNVLLKRSVLETICEEEGDNASAAKEVTFANPIETSTAASTSTVASICSDATSGATTVSMTADGVPLKSNATEVKLPKKPKQYLRIKKQSFGRPMKKLIGQRLPRVTLQEIVCHAINLLWNVRECPLVGNHAAISVSLGRLIVSSTALKQTKSNGNRTELPRQLMVKAIKSAVATCWEAIDPSQSDARVADEFLSSEAFTKNVFGFLSLVDFEVKKLRPEKRISHQTLQQELKIVLELPQYLRAKGGSLENTAFVFNDQNATRCLCTELNSWSRLEEQVEVFPERTFKVRPTFGMKGNIAFREEELPLFSPLDVQVSEMLIFNADDEERALILWEW